MKLPGRTMKEFWEQHPILFYLTAAVLMAMSLWVIFFLEFGR